MILKKTTARIGTRRTIQQLSWVVEIYAPTHRYKIRFDTFRMTLLLNSTKDYKVKIIAQFRDSILFFCSIYL